jgi:hypothetical protein
MGFGSLKQLPLMGPPCFGSKVKLNNQNVLHGCCQTVSAAAPPMGPTGRDVSEKQQLQNATAEQKQSKVGSNTSYCSHLVQKPCEMGQIGLGSEQHSLQGTAIQAAACAAAQVTSGKESLLWDCSARICIP